MAEQGVVTAESMAQDMRELLRSMHENDYSDVDQLGRFIVLYDGSSKMIDDSDPQAREAFFASLDVPEVELEFDEGRFEDIVEAYDELGGDRTKLYFPDVDHEPAKDWTEELRELSEIFSDEYRERVGKLHPNVLHAHSVARYIREHSEELRAADTDGTYESLITNPNFLTAFARVHMYDEQERPNSRADFDRKYEEGVFLESVLDAIGYQAASTYYQDWRYHHNDDMAVDNIEPNIRAIAELENERPGAIRLLSGFYGIRHFARYAPELLIEQVDTHGDASRPYGVVMSAVSDHNGAFSRSAVLKTPTHDQLYEQVQGAYGIRICEAGTKKEFKERLAALDALYGDKEKISFAVIQAHGRHDSIHLGGWTNAGSIALTSKLKGVRSAFKPNACISLDSCSTGQINGVGQAISRRLGVTVVAPVEATGIARINFVTDESGVRLVPEYVKGRNMLDKREEAVEAAVYKDGKPLGRKRTTAYLSIGT